MSKITNSDLAKVLMEKHGLDKADAERFVALMFDILNNGLRQDKLVKIKGLGTFKVISVSSRKSVDVNTGKPIIIEGRDKISFTPDNNLRDKVNAPFAQFDTVVINDGVDFSTIDQSFQDKENTPATVAEQPQATADEFQETTPVLEQQPTAEDKQEMSEPVQQSIEVETQASEVKREPIEEMKQEPTVEVEQEPNEEVEQKPNDEAESVATEVEQAPASEANDEAEQPVANDELPHDAETPTSDNEPEEGMVSDSKTLRRRYIIMIGVAAAVVILLLGGSIFYFVNQLQIRDNRISRLEEMMSKEHSTPAKRQVVAKTTKTATPVAKPQKKVNVAPTSTSLSADKKAGAVKPSAEKAVVSKPQKASTPVKSSAANNQRLNKETADNKENAATVSSDNSQAEAAPDYNKDIRIRTGAYNVVGIDKTVTVKQGQSLSSISRTYLGPGMECYVEAVNHGKTSYKAGDKINIPKVKLKKRKK
ncbi:MAG: HU family DNA-binding protein [Prevotella sp.]|nr:HU family DNA-binding protein [Prevotella sp.]